MQVKSYSSNRPLSALAMDVIRYAAEGRFSSLKDISLALQDGEYLQDVHEETGAGMGDIEAAHSAIIGAMMGEETLQAREAAELVKEAQVIELRALVHKVLCEESVRVSTFRAPQFYQSFLRDGEPFLILRAAIPFKGDLELICAFGQGRASLKLEDGEIVETSLFSEDIDDARIFVTDSGAPDLTE